MRNRIPAPSALQPAPSKLARPVARYKSLVQAGETLDAMADELEAGKRTPTFCNRVDGKEYNAGQVLDNAAMDTAPDIANLPAGTSD